MKGEGLFLEKSRATFIILKRTSGNDLSPWPNFQTGFYLNYVKQISSQSILKPKWQGDSVPTASPCCQEVLLNLSPSTASSEYFLSFYLKRSVNIVFIHVCVARASRENTIISQSNVFLRHWSHKVGLTNTLSTFGKGQDHFLLLQCPQSVPLLERSGILLPCLITTSGASDTLPHRHCLPLLSYPHRKENISMERWSTNSLKRSHF